MAELKLIAPGGIRASLQRLLPLFEKTTGHQVAPTFTSGGAAKSRTIAGEAFDVPIVQPPLEQVVASGQVVATSEAPLATVSVVAAVRAGAPRPDISQAAGVAHMLLDTASIACPSAGRGAACGVSFEATLAKLGIAATVMPKVKPAPSGWEAIAMLARGEVELGITFNSEIEPDSRVELLGPLPRDISTPTGFVAFVNARSERRQPAEALISFSPLARGRKDF